MRGGVEAPQRLHDRFVLRATKIAALWQ